MSYGTDIWEIRADLLSSSTEPIRAPNLPPLEYVKKQISLLQQHSELPILFTIRTVSQGGKFPDDEAQLALEMMLAAVEVGCEYIDVKIEWPESLVVDVNQRKGNSKVVASFHDWTGGIRWSSEVLKEKYLLADKMGG
jgi:pentafunctional AROM polypeptide